ncbi:MAG TPA: hypothetical protein VF533_01475 [Solirubrobacteraceae bacterium]|jgi:hypothetical protein
MDEWFSHLHADAQKSIWPRFRSPRRDAHLGAFHELYEHEVAVRGNYDEVDCDIGREDPQHLRPDLLLARAQDRCFVEVTVALGDDVVAPNARRRVHQLYDAIDRIRNRNFLLGVDVRGVGAATPGRNLTGPITAWLNTLDADDEITRVAAGGAPAARCFSNDGWKAIITATGFKPHLRGHTGGLIGERIEGFGGYTHIFEGERRIEVDGPRPLRDDELLGTVLRKKLKHGYETGDTPFILAVLCAGIFVEDRDVAAALIGPDGVWPDGDGKRYERLAGVITVANLSPTAVAVVEPTLWTNPNAAHPIATDFFPWRRMEVRADGSVVEHPATRSVADVLGISPGFPAR